MRSFATTARIPGVAAATAALVGAGLFSANTAAADERPISPDQAPQIMERAWPEYSVGDHSVDINAVTTYLTAETDAEGTPYWQGATDDFTEELASALLGYQADHGLGEHGQIKEELWIHFSDAQFGGGADWGPGGGRDFYTQGDAGEGVEALQRLLISHGQLGEGEDDGQYGPATEGAVEGFQSEQVCPEVAVSAQSCVDGLVGEVTYRALVTIEWSEPYPATGRSVHEGAVRPACARTRVPACVPSPGPG